MLFGKKKGVVVEGGKWCEMMRCASVLFDLWKEVEEKMCVYALVFCGG